MRFFLIGFISLISANVFYGDSPIGKQSDKRFSVIVSGRGEPIPDASFIVVISPKGNFRDIMSFPISDENLKKYLQKSYKNDREARLYLKVAEQAETSINFLSQSIERIKGLADPNFNTILVIWLK